MADERPMELSLTRLWRTLRPQAQLVVFGLSVLALGVGARTFLTSSQTGLAVWWPAVAVGVVGTLLATPRQRTMVLATLLVASVASNLIGGIDPVTALLLGLTGVVEAALVVRLLGIRRPDARALEDHRDLMQVLGAILAGAVGAGLVVGVVTVTHLDGSFLQALLTIVPSHASALLLIVPLTLRGPSRRVEAGRGERAAQLAVVAVVAVAVFAPNQVMPLTFLLFPALLWSALRSGVRSVALHLLVVGAVGSVMTLQGWGPFVPSSATADATVYAESIAMVQLLVVTLAVVALGVVVTVSQRRAAMAALERRERRYRGGFEGSLLGQLLLRPEPRGARIVEVNGAAAVLLDAQPDELVGQLLDDHLSDDDRDRVREAIAEMVEGRSLGWHGEFANDRDRCIEAAIAPLAEHGEVSPDLLSVQLIDATANREAEMRLVDLALRDGLTGSANRVLLDERLERALADARRSDRAVGLIFLDLDGLKPVNDSYGHLVGDRLLIELADRLTAAVREVDTVARVGGDEFVVLAPDLGHASDLAAVVERIREALDVAVPVDGVAHRLAASIGAVMGRGDDTARDLLQAADEAMYRDKATRRASSPA